MSLEEDFNAHGVLLLNSNAMGKRAGHFVLTILIDNLLIVCDLRREVNDSNPPRLV